MLSSGAGSAAETSSVSLPDYQITPRPIPEITTPVEPTVAVAAVEAPVVELPTLPVIENAVSEVIEVAEAAANAVSTEELTEEDVNF